MVFFLVDKSDVFATFKSFVKGIHNEFETTIKRFLAVQPVLLRVCFRTPCL